MLERIYAEPQEIDLKQMKLVKNIVTLKKKKLGFSIGRNLNAGYNGGGVAFQGGSVTLC
jgi:hypothetical protein